MKNSPLAIRSTLLTAAVAVFCTGIQLAAVDSLAQQRGAQAAVQLVRLPTVTVSAKREAVALAVEQLPTVVVVGQRLAQTSARASGSATGPST